MVSLSNLLLLCSINVCLPDNEASRKVINKIWTETPSTTVSDRRGGTTTRRDIGPGDADLPHSEDEDADAVDDDDIISGVPWDDPSFLTPSFIKLLCRTFTGIEWMRPPVSNSSLFQFIMFFNLKF